MATLSDLVNEVVERGYQYESTTAIEVSIKRHHQRLEARYAWPWLEAGKEGSAPLEIKDLRDVLSVTDKTQERPLYGQSRQWLIERYPNLEEQGSPLWWRLDNLTIRTFPLSEDTIVVRYVRKPPQLEAATEPLMPSEWHYLIVDSVVVDLLKNNDEYSVARELKESIQTDLGEMMASELQRDLQSPRLTVRSGPPGTYL